MKLDKKGRCCLFHPVFYKGSENSHPSYYKCPTCKREYNLNGAQQESLIWKKNVVGRYCCRNAEDKRGYIIQKFLKSRRDARAITKAKRGL